MSSARMKRMFHCGAAFAASRFEVHPPRPTVARRAAAPAAMRTRVPREREVSAFMSFMSSALLPWLCSRVPDRGRDVALLVGLVVEVVDRHEHAVRPLDGPRIAEVPGPAILTEHDLDPPAPAGVGAEPRPDTVRGRA